MSTYVVIFSGGMDSATLLHDLLEGGATCHALTIDYGQRHRREIDAAASFVAHMRTLFGDGMGEHRIADLAGLGPLLAGSSQTDRTIAVPHGHYSEENMKLTVVPNRNMILLAVAAGWAVAVHANGVAYGAHAGDHAIYPDCRAAFVEAMRQALSLCDWQDVELVTPFIGLDKGAIARRGCELETPYALTWTCYEGADQPCGLCGACCERHEAFEAVGIPDPLTGGAG